MSTKAAVILAAGKGVRMRSGLSKVLHKICGKELVRHVVDSAKAAGYDRIVVIVSPANHDPVHDLLGDSVGYALQTDTLGTGHAVLQARDLLSGVDTVAVLNGDVPLIRPETLRSLLERHEAQDARATLLTAHCDIAGLARVVRNSSGAIAEIVEERDADERTKAIGEVNVGSYCFKGPWLWDALEKREDVGCRRILSPGGRGHCRAAVERRRSPSGLSEPAAEALGINDRVQLSEAENILQERIRLHWMKSGVTMPSPTSVYIDADVSLGEDTIVLPNTHITGGTRVADRCLLGPNSIIDDARIGSECRVWSSVVEGSDLEARVSVGPFTHIRPGSRIAEGVVLGNFAEVNRSEVGRNTKSVHFSYLGDAEIGENVNIGAGTVTVNYDGVSKLPTRIGDGAFIGCDTMLVAPVEVGSGAQTAAGAVVTKDVPPDAMAVGVPARLISKNKRKSDGGGDSS